MALDSLGHDRKSLGVRRKRRREEQRRHGLHRVDRLRRNGVPDVLFRRVSLRRRARFGLVARTYPVADHYRKG